MSTPTPAEAPTFDPAQPMTPEFRADLAYRRAHGWSWEELGRSLSCRPDELRRAARKDAAFAAELTQARAEAEAEAGDDLVAKLRQLVRDGGVHALEAATILAKHQSDRQRNETRLTIERERIAARAAADRAKTDRAAVKAPAQEEEVVVVPRREVKETEQEWQKRSDREHAQRAAEPEAKVYLWGGRHQLGRSIAPDESDLRVRLSDDWSVPCYPPELGPIYWVVPFGANTHAPGPREAQAADALKETFSANPPQPPGEEATLS